jgi:hypothetical protein
MHRVPGQAGVLGHRGQPRGPRRRRRAGREGLPQHRRRARRGRATAADLAKVTVYIVDLDDAKAEQFVVGRERAAATLGVEFQQPSTWIGVTSLAAPGYLVEIDAVAVLA